MELNELIRDTYQILGFEYPGEEESYTAPEIGSRKEIASYIDHTILKSDCDLAGVKKVCDEAKQYGFASVCVNPSYISYVAEQLEGTDVAPCSVICFPFGTQTPEAKAFEADDAVKNGAEEIDMVINVAFLKDGRADEVWEEIAALRKVTKGKILKVIVETCYLTEEEKVLMCQIVKETGADYIKTSTGFGTGNATFEDVALFAKCLEGSQVKIKASGGIRTWEDAEKFLELGADRLGSSALIKSLV